MDWLRGGCRGTVMLGIAEGYQPVFEHGVDAGLDVGARAHLVEQVTV